MRTLIKSLNLFRKKEFIIDKTSVLQNDDLHDDLHDDTDQSVADAEQQVTSDVAQLLHVPNTIKNEKEISDLVAAVERMAHSHHMTKHKYAELQNRFDHHMHQLDEQLKEKERLQSFIQNKEQTIDMLENKLAEQNLKFDQLIEEHNATTAQLSNQLGELKNAVDVERKKYSTINQQYTAEALDWANQLKKKDEQILILQSENSNLKEQNEQMRTVNNYLSKTVNDFTSQLSVSVTNYGERSSSGEQTNN